MKVSTQVTDIGQGRAATNLSVTLEAYAGAGQWKECATGMTDARGRIDQILGKGVALNAGRYRMTFQTASYFDAIGLKAFYPYVTAVFEVTEPAQDLHLPLVLSPYGYSFHKG